MTTALYIFLFLFFLALLAWVVWEEGTWRD